MKIVLVQPKGEEDAAAWLGPFSKKMKIPVEICPVTEDPGSAVKQFAAIFGSQAPKTGGEGQAQTESPTHVIVLPPITGHWLDFLAGFACGSLLPVVVYGKEALPDEYSSFFIPFTTKVSLEKYLEAEYEISSKNKAVMEIRKARETLLNMGVPVDEESLARCVDEGRDREVSLFLGSGFSPDSRGKSGTPLLSISARKGNREMLQLLLRAGAHVNLQSSDRASSALIDCTIGRHTDMVKDLIEYGADVNIIDKEGQSALILAAGGSDEAIVELLLKAGADPDVQDSLGVSARKYASLFRKESVMNLFATYAPQKAG